MLKVVIIGYGEMFTNLIAGTLDAGCETVGVLRKDTIKFHPFIRKIKDILNPSVDYNYIQSYNLPEISSVKSVNSESFKKKLLKLNPDIILIGSWGEKLNSEIYSIPKIATINAHPSLLPKYRGPNPYFWVIKNKEQVSGVSFHLVDKNFDTGAILAQEEVKIFHYDTGYSLKQRTVLTARGCVCELLKDLLEDIKIPLQQRENNATYYSYPNDFELDFTQSSEDNCALLRACYPWYTPYFYHKDTPLVPCYNKVSIVDNTTKFAKAGTITDKNCRTGTISVLCSDNKILQMDNIKYYNKYNQPFTNNYILKDVQIGDVITKV